MSILERLAFWRKGPTTVRIDRADAFRDFSLPIVGSGATEAGERWFHARALFKGEAVGFVVQLACEWSPWHVEEHDLTLWRGHVTYRSAGLESDHFLRMVARQYRVRRPERMAASTTFAAIALEGNPGEFPDGNSKVKLFFESDLETEYAEFYTNVYPTDAVLEFHEKDVDYRRAVVAALSRGAAA